MYYELYKYANEFANKRDMYPAYRIQMSFKFRVMSEGKSERDIKIKVYIKS